MYLESSASSSVCNVIRVSLRYSVIELLATGRHCVSFLKIYEKYNIMGRKMSGFWELCKLSLNGKDTICNLYYAEMNNNESLANM